MNNTASVALLASKLIDAITKADEDEQFPTAAALIRGFNAQHDHIARMIATEIAAAFDLCPMHACDVEICIDDDEPECRGLRADN